MPEAPRVAAIDAVDRRLINALQGDFPLVAEPYRQVAGDLGLDEAELLRRLDAMLERRVLTRFGPMFQIERAGGAFVLATATPEGIADAVARIEAATGLPVFPFPKEREYFVEMKLRA